jgi:hypothetical protein
VRRIGPIALGLLVLARSAAGADGSELQLRPFVGIDFAGSTTFVDLDSAVSCSAAVHPGGCRLRNGTFGVDGVWIGEIVGVEGDVAFAPGFFQSGQSHNVLHSGVVTASGSIIVAAPKHLTEYTLRPYGVAGVGIMHVWSSDALELLKVSQNLAVLNVGGGVVGFLTNRVGVAWEVRRFGSLRGTSAPVGTTIGGPARLSFWRASMAVVLRRRR